MKIAYGTYALPETPLEAAIPMLTDLGYDGVEICISRQHVGSMPDELDPARRQKIKRAVAVVRAGTTSLPWRSAWRYGASPVTTYSAPRAGRNRRWMVRLCRSRGGADLGSCVAVAEN